MEHVAKESFDKYFWFGTGLVKHSRIRVPSNEDHWLSVYHAHNSYLDALYRTGIFNLVFHAGSHGVRTQSLAMFQGTVTVFHCFLFGCLVGVVASSRFFWLLDGIWRDNCWIPQV